jgi:hypothetical protein
LLIAVKSGRSDGRCELSHLRRTATKMSFYWPSSPPENGELDECCHEGVCAAGEGVAQLEAEGSDAGAGASAGLAAALLAGAFLEAAFFADFFGAAFFADFPAFDFFADFLADFLTDFLADFLADFFFAASVFLPLAFLPFFFLPLAIVILLLGRIYRALKIVCFRTRPVLSNRFWPGTTRRPIEKLNRVHYRN